MVVLLKGETKIKQINHSDKGANKKMAQADNYLKIDTIEGETDAAGFEKQIQVLSYSLGAINKGSARIGTGMGSGKVSFEDFKFKIHNGKASPALFLACCLGNHIPQAVLTLRKTGGDGSPYPYMKFTFGDLHISGFRSNKPLDDGENSNQNVNDNVPDEGPVDYCSFNFTKITVEYLQQKADGSTSLTNTVTYDIKKVLGEGA